MNISVTHLVISEQSAQNLSADLTSVSGCFLDFRRITLHSGAKHYSASKQYEHKLLKKHYYLGTCVFGVSI